MTAVCALKRDKKALLVMMDQDSHVLMMKLESDQYIFSFVKLCLSKPVK